MEKLEQWNGHGIRFVEHNGEVYQPPFESSKKQYFRVSDVINFLTVR